MTCACPLAGRDLPGLQCPSDETQSRKAAKGTGENEGDPHPPASASSHHMIPAALKTRSAILRMAGIRSCYRNRDTVGASAIRTEGTIFALAPCYDAITNEVPVRP